MRRRDLSKVSGPTDVRAGVSLPVSQDPERWLASIHTLAPALQGSTWVLLSSVVPPLPPQVPSCQGGSPGSWCRVPQGRALKGRLGVQIFVRPRNCPSQLLLSFFLITSQPRSNPGPAAWAWQDSLKEGASPFCLVKEEVT